MVKLPRIRLPDLRRARALGARVARQSQPVVVFAICVGLIIIILSLAMRTQEKSEAVSKANGISSPILDLCLRGDETARTLAAARTPDGKSLCEAAAEVKTDPVTAPVQNLDEARIRELIGAELARRQLTATPDMEQLVAAARTVIEANSELFKGDPGQPASPAEIAAVVSTYIQANAEMFRGRPGEPGKMGPVGRPGDSFGGLSWALRGGSCNAVVRVVTPTGVRNEYTPVPMALCREPAPVTTTMTIPPSTVTTTLPPTTVTPEPPDDEPDTSTSPSVTSTPDQSLEPSEPPSEGG